MDTLLPLLLRTSFGGESESFTPPSEKSPENKDDQISLKDIGLLTLARLVFTATTPFVGGLSLSCERLISQFIQKHCPKHLCQGWTSI